MIIDGHDALRLVVVLVAALVLFAVDRVHRSQRTDAPGGRPDFRESWTAALHGWRRS